MTVELTNEERDLILRALREMHTAWNGHGMRTEKLDELINKMIGVK